jgi:hypothetical protein
LRLLARLGPAGRRPDDGGDRPLPALAGGAAVQLLQRTDDVAIPGIAGLLALAWPQMFLRKPDEERKIRRVRLFGVLFLVIASAYLAMRLAGV